jgi:hypothetical protein
MYLPRISVAPFSTAAVRGATPWGAQHRDMIVLLWVEHEEANGHHRVDKLKIRRKFRGPGRIEVPDMERKFVLSDLDLGGAEYRLIGTPVVVGRQCFQQLPSAVVEYGKLDAHPHTRAACEIVEDVGRNACHDGESLFQLPR